MASKKTEDFFYEHAGFSYDPAVETSEQGKRRSAKALAEAEDWAAEEDYVYIWHSEEEDWSTFLDGTEVDVDDVSDILWVSMENTDEFSVLLLGGIIEGHDEKQNRNYRRVVEAELALEVMERVGAVPQRPGASAELQFINLHRAQFGQRPLDPVASGWGPEDIVVEARRIRALNPRPRVSFLEGAVATVLTGLGVTGIVLGRRKK